MSHDTSKVCIGTLYYSGKIMGSGASSFEFKLVLNFLGYNRELLIAELEAKTKCIGVCTY